MKLAYSLSDHAVGVCVEKVDLVFVDSFCHATASSKQWAAALVAVVGRCERGHHGFLNFGVGLFVERVVLDDALRRRAFRVSCDVAQLQGGWLVVG